MQSTATLQEFFFIASGRVNLDYPVDLLSELRQNGPNDDILYKSHNLKACFSQEEKEEKANMGGKGRKRQYKRKRKRKLIKEEKEGRALAGTDAFGTVRLGRRRREGPPGAAPSDWPINP